MEDCQHGLYLLAEVVTGGVGLWATGTISSLSFRANEQIVLRVILLPKSMY